MKLRFNYRQLFLAGLLVLTGLCGASHTSYAQDCGLSLSVIAATDGLVGEARPFTASLLDPSCVSAATYAWDFGDGSPVSTAVTTTHAYSAPGIYTWTFRATLGDQVSEWTGGITIAASCSGNFLSATRAFSAAGGNGNLSVSVFPSTCVPSLNSSAAWITATGVIPDTTIATYIVAPNPDPTPRVGQLTLGTSVLTISQGGVGAPAPAIAEDRPGSVLVYNLVASQTNAPQSENTDLSLINTHTTKSVKVHFYFVDSNGCSVRESFACLAPGQTKRMLAAATGFLANATGYLLAVAVNDNGLPINFNWLIGSEQVKLATGYTADLPAVGFTAIAGTESNRVVALK